MKNLRLLFNLTYDNDIFIQSDLLCIANSQNSAKINSSMISAFCFCNGFLYAADSDKKVSQLYDFRNNFGDNDPPKAISMWYRDLYDTLFVCFENGEIISLLLSLSGVKTIESSLLEHDVQEISWSPDEEYAIVVSRAQKLFIINSDFHTLSEIDIFDPLPGEKELINVGWGKKETQFHGSEGKVSTIEGPKVVDNSHLKDSHNFWLTWRGDSSLFAVGYWCPQKKSRRIKIFNNEGVLQCTSEDISGIEEPLSWKPLGNLIAFPQQLPNKHVIAFMEKNGLKHGEFSLPNGLKVKNLCWNESSTILCIVCENEETKKEEILLWTAGNYHWYLKQKLNLNFVLKDVWWDKAKPYRLYILGSDGLHEIEWAFTVNTSYNSSCVEQSYVAVIDGCDILLTSFKEAIIPPPMYSYKLQLPLAVNQVIFSPSDCSSYLLCAVLCDGSIAFFSDIYTEPIILSDFYDKAFHSSLVLSMGHWEWASSRILIFIYYKDNTTYITHWETDVEKMYVRHNTFIEGKVITCNRTSEKVAMQTLDGQLMFYDYKKLKCEKENFSLPEPSSDVKIHSSGIYSLSEWSRLYVNGSQISLPSVSGNVTSFLLKDPYILLTTSSHKLIILHFNNIKCVEISARKLERGSQLITTSGNSVILQTPRGNLETIQPRALTILTLGNLINSKFYKSALSLMRKQRIDLNLIVDHNQKSFVEDSSLFVQQVDPQWLTLLITELNSDDVTKTSYDLYYKSKDRNNHTILNGNKVRTVCENLLMAMSVDEECKNRYILPILSSLVKIGEMGKAIKIANNQQSLQHLLFLVDVNKLYLEALGAYDLEAALKIAEKSQKDPKEYIPYLNSLKEMEPNYMKFTIDKSLNKLNSSLSHLSKCTGVHLEECMAFIRENSLYSSALRLFKGDKERLALIACLYGDHLYKQRNYEESGIMYLRGGDSEKSIQSFTRSGNWRQCMIIAKKENFSNEKCYSLAQSICSMLSSSHKFLDAAIMYLEWLSDIEKAVVMYIQGKYWKEAIYTSEKHNKPELLGEIKESLMEAADALCESILGNKEKVEKYVSRLQVVRVEKQNRPAFTFDDFSDTASDTSSISSLRTKSFQSRSSKNTKKMNRKMWSLKEGSHREEEALVATLSQLIQSSEKCVADVHQTCSTLLVFEEDIQAEKLQTSMSDWLKLIDSSKKIIWPKDPEMNETAILDEKFKYPPEITIMNGWEFKYLKEN